MRDFVSAGWLGACAIIGVLAIEGCAMTMLEEVERLIELLSPADRAELLARLEKHASPTKKPDETRVRAFDTAVDDMQSGLTAKQLDELEWAMNVETTDIDGEIL
jgi:hypothetical protein